LPLDGIFTLSERSASNLPSKIRGSIETEGISGVKQLNLFDGSILFSSVLASVVSYLSLDPFFLFFLSSTAYVALTALLRSVAVWENYSRSASGLVSG